MKLLQERIQKDGQALSETILKVDSFLNHQMDPKLMSEMGQEFAHYFAKHGITKVFTIESSGIAPAIFTALAMGLQLVTLKKQPSKVLKDDLLQTQVHSFTKGLDYQLTLSKNYIDTSDRVLIIDDFLANGEAAMGAVRLVEAAGANVAGIGIVIEKSFQPGRTILEEMGFDVYSLARIGRLSPGHIDFVE